MGGEAERDRPQIAVAVGNPDHAEQLVRTAVDVARDRDGEVFVVGVVVTPSESPFALFTDDIITQEFGGERQAILDRAIEVASGTGVPVSGRLFVASSVARGVLHAVKERNSECLIVGWQAGDTTTSEGGRWVNGPLRGGTVLGGDVGRIVRRADCDVLVEKIGAVADGVRAVLLPVAESPHADLAAGVARAIAVSNDARVDLLRVVDESDDEPAARDLLGALAEQLSGVEVNREIRVGDPADEIITASRSRDVTVLGATRTGVIRRRVMGSTPQNVSQHAEGTIIVARAGGGSVLSRLFRL